MSTLRREGTAATADADGAGVYGRESHASYKSISDQIDNGIQDVGRLGWGRPLVYSDDVSASRYGSKPRGGWRRVLADIAAGALKRLWLWESSRGDRKAAEWLDFLDLCAERGVLIHVASHGRTYDPRNRRDWKSLAEDGIDSEDESRRMSERIRRGMAQSAAQGLPHGQTPFGFVRVYDERTRRLVRQQADEEGRVSPTGHSWTPAGIVREMFDDVLAGCPLVWIADKLNARGIPSPRVFAAMERGTPKTADHWAATKWTPTVVRRILLSPGTIGQRINFGETVSVGGWDALVSEETFLTVGNILRDPKRKTMRPGAAKYLLTCLARCGVCGEFLTRNKAYPERYKPAIYRCRSNKVCVGVTQEALDAYVTGWVLRWLTEPGRLGALENLLEDEASEATAARVEEERLRGQLEEWRATLDDPNASVSPAAFARREKALMEALAEAQRRARAATASASVSAFWGVTDEARAAAVWMRLDLAAQRDIIRELVTVRVMPIGRGKGQRKDKLASMPGRVEIDPAYDV